MPPRRGYTKGGQQGRRLREERRSHAKYPLKLTLTEATLIFYEAFAPSSQNPYAKIPLFKESIMPRILSDAKRLEEIGLGVKKEPKNGND